MKLIDADRLKEVFKRNTGYDYADIIDMQPTVNALDKIRAEIDKQIEYNTYFNSDMAKGEIIAFEWVKRKIDEYGKEQE